MLQTDAKVVTQEVLWIVGKGLARHTPRGFAPWRSFQLAL